jgi:hypothetical protein
MLPVIEQCGPFVISRRQPGELSTGRDPGMAGDLTDLRRHEAVIVSAGEEKARSQGQSSQLISRAEPLPQIRIIKDEAIGAYLINEPSQQAVPIVYLAGRVE